MLEILIGIKIIYIFEDNANNINFDTVSDILKRPKIPKSVFSADFHSIVFAEFKIFRGNNVLPRYYEPARITGSKDSYLLTYTFCRQKMSKCH